MTTLHGRVTTASAGGIFGVVPSRLSSSPPASLAGRFVIGLAVPFNEVSHVAHGTGSGEAKRFRFHLGAFQESLFEIWAGRRHVELLREHNPHRVIGSTADGDWLSLEETNQGLRVRIDSRTGRGQLVRYISERDRTLNLSAGFFAEEFTRQPMADGSVILDVTRASLFEVSIVNRGAFKGTYLLPM